MITAVVWFLIGSLFGLAAFLLAAEGGPRRFLSSSNDERPQP